MSRFQYPPGGTAVPSADVNEGGGDDVVHVRYQPMMSCVPELRPAQRERGGARSAKNPTKPKDAVSITMLFQMEGLEKRFLGNMSVSF